MAYQATTLPEDVARQIDFARLLADAQLTAAVKIVDDRGTKGAMRETMAFALLDVISRNYAASIK